MGTEAPGSPSLEPTGRRGADRGGHVVGVGRERDGSPEPVDRTVPAHAGAVVLASAGSTIRPTKPRARRQASMERAATVVIRPRSRARPWGHRGLPIHDPRFRGSAGRYVETDTPISNTVVSTRLRVVVARGRPGRGGSSSRGRPDRPSAGTGRRARARRAPGQAFAARDEDVPPSPDVSAPTAEGTSPSRSVAFFHDSSRSVDETTCSGMRVHLVREVAGAPATPRRSPVRDTAEHERLRVEHLVELELELPAFHREVDRQPRAAVPGAPPGASITPSRAGTR